MKLSVRKTFLLTTLSFLALGLILKSTGSSTQNTFVEKKPVLDKPKGDVFGQSIGLPPSWPSNFPLSTGSTITSSSYNKNSGQASFQVDQELLKLTKFYEENLSILGWTNLGNNKYQKGNTNVNLTFTKMDAAGTIFIVNYSLVPTK